MKRINKYILEKLHVNKDVKVYCPRSKDELIHIIRQRLKGIDLRTIDVNRPLNLNDIDVYKVTDMSYLFSNELGKGQLLGLAINGCFDVSEWDVSNVKDMSGMFARSNFDGDLSKWNVENVENMYGMFEHSRFTSENGSLNGWNVKSLVDSRNMFNRSGVYNLPHWYEE